MSDAINKRRRARYAASRPELVKTRRCEFCGRRISATRRTDAKYCTDRHAYKQRLVMSKAERRLSLPKKS